MSFDMKILLKQHGSMWSLYSPKGHELTDPRPFSGEVQALEWARAWASSWQGVTIEVVKNEPKKT